jgi:hypothetical protein
MRHSAASSFPPRSGYDELDTTLMPPRATAEQYTAAAGKQQQ